MVIIDEAHNYKTDIKMKDNKVKSGKNIYAGYKCFLLSDKLLLLTGTPLYNNPIDLNLFKVLLNYYPDSPSIEYPSKYMNSVSNAHYYRRRRVQGLMDAINSYKNQDLKILKCKISYHDFEKNDKDFPRRINKIEKINMREDYEKQYLKIVDEIEGEEKKVIPRVFQNFKETNENQFLNLTRRATQNIDNNVKLNAKLDFVQKLITKYNDLNKSLSKKDKYKVVIYSQFINHGIELIKNIIDVNSATISGKTKVSERADICDQFNKGNNTVLFLTNAGGEGLDLKGTDAIVLMEPTWNNNTSEQVIARAIRYKSHANRPDDRKKVEVFRLCHISKEDRSEDTKQYIKDYMSNLERRLHMGQKIFPSVMYLSKNIVSCDLVMETYQQAKQLILDYYDKQLQDLAIENNQGNCLTIAYPDGTLYEGEWSNKEANGNGKMTFINGDIYEGQWRNGLPNGDGRLITNRGRQVLIGKFKDGVYISTSSSSTSSSSISIDLNKRIQQLEKQIANKQQQLTNINTLNKRIQQLDKQKQKLERLSVLNKKIKSLQKKIQRKRQQQVIYISDSDSEESTNTKKKKK
jgi:hypothetical protein